MSYLFAIPESLSLLIIILYLLLVVYVVWRSVNYLNTQRINGQQFLIMLFATLFLPIIGVVVTYIFLVSKGRIKNDITT